MDKNCMDNGAHKPANNGFDGESDHEDISDTERNVDDTSETEKAKILLYDGIQKLVQDSVQEIKRSRTERKKKRKRVIANVGEPRVNEKDANAYSRCSLPLLARVISCIKCSEHKISLVRKIGFEETLHIDDCYIPRLFAQWLADNTLPDEEIMKFGDRTIPINPQSFVDVLGIPAGPLPVETDEDFGKAAFLGVFSLSEMPTIKYLCDKIINEENLGDDEFCICYGAVVMSAFICPNSSPRPSTKYMGALVDVANMKNRNWSLFAHRWMMCYIKKYLKEQLKKDKLTITLGGCIYQQSVRYLDFIDLGPIKLPSTLPRIRVWKGDLIKHFSQMDKGDNGNYGSHIVRDVSETCYARPIVGSPLINGGRHHFKNEIERVAGDHMSDKVKNELFEAFQNHMFGAESEPYLRAQLLVIDMMKIITSEGVNKTTSEITVPLTQESSKQDCEAPMKKKQKFDVNSTIDQLSQTDAGLDCSPNAKIGDSDLQEYDREKMMFLRLKKMMYDIHQDVSEVSV